MTIKQLESIIESLKPDDLLASYYRAQLKARINQIPYVVKKTNNP